MKALKYDRLNSILFVLFVFLFSSNLIAQIWTEEQLRLANTAKDADITQVEKDAILYINLARLYPKLFLTIEVENYFGTERFVDYVKNSPYKKSLIKTLTSMKALDALMFDIKLNEDAKCFSKESGEKGIVGHTRKICKEGNYAECCSYGMTTGKDIAMSWLIDFNTQSLGHRKICLNPKYSKIGLSVHDHKKWEICAVAEFI